MSSITKCAPEPNMSQATNSPFQKGNPFKSKNYNKLLWQFSLAVVVLLLLGLFSSTYTAAISNR
jgi:hypothetical protein